MTPDSDVLCLCMCTHASAPVCLWCRGQGTHFRLLLLLYLSLAQWPPRLNLMSSPVPLDEFQHALTFSQPPRCLTSSPVCLLVSSPFFSIFFPLSYPTASLLDSLSILAILFLWFSFHLPDFFPILPELSCLSAFYFSPFATHSKPTIIKKNMCPWTRETFSLSMGFCLCILPPWRDIL